jgi:hypothetical protein
MRLAQLIIVFGFLHFRIRIALSGSEALEGVNSSKMGGCPNCRPARATATRLVGRGPEQSRAQWGIDMNFSRASMIASTMVAGLVAVVSVADAQIAVVEQKLLVFKQASVGGWPGHTEPQPVVDALALQEQLPVPLATVQAAMRGDPMADGLIKQRAQFLSQVISGRDAAAKDLAEAIDATMKTMDPNNQQDLKRLDEIFDEIQAINKTTTDALLRYDETLALLKEQAAAGATTQ